MSSLLGSALLKNRKIELRKKSKLEWLGVVLLGAVLFMGAHSAVGEEFVWDGNSVVQCLSTPGCWDLEDNWDLDNGYPGFGDDVTITDVSPLDTCTYNIASQATLAHLTVGGDSPTEMTLHLRDGGMLLQKLLTMQDYGLIDADQDLTVDKDTYLMGSDFIEVADDVTVQLGDVYVKHYGPYVNYFTAQLDATVDGDGVLTAEKLIIDADFPEDDHVGLIYDGHGANFEVAGEISVTARQDCIEGGCTDIKWALLKVSTGTLEFSATLLPQTFTIDGGNDYDYRRSIVEVKTELSAANVTFSDGYSQTDVDATKYFRGGDVTFQVGAIAKKTGAGTFKSGS